MGITWWQFWELNPHIIKCISKGYKEQKIETDAMMHAWWGTYGLSAVAVAVEHCLSGKKAKSEFVKTPLLQTSDEKTNEKSLSVKELEKKAENVFLQLGIMGANFNNQKQGQ